MPLDKIIIVRVEGELKSRLHSIAKESKISDSALARSTLCLALVPSGDSEADITLQKIIAEAQRETNKFLWKRNREDKPNE